MKRAFGVQQIHKVRYSGVLSVEHRADKVSNRAPDCLASRLIAGSRRPCRVNCIAGLFAAKAAPILANQLTYAARQVIKLK